MNAFAVAVFIAATVLLVLVLYAMGRRTAPPRFTRMIEGYGLVMLVTAWVFLLASLAYGTFTA